MNPTNCHLLQQHIQNHHSQQQHQQSLANEQAANGQLTYANSLLNQSHQHLPISLTSSSNNNNNGFLNNSLNGIRTGSPSGACGVGMSGNSQGMLVTGSSNSNMLHPQQSGQMMHSSMGDGSQQAVSSSQMMMNMSGSLGVNGQSPQNHHLREASLLSLPSSMGMSLYSATPLSPGLSQNYYGQVGSLNRSSLHVYDHPSNQSMSNGNMMLGAMSNKNLDQLHLHGTGGGSQYHVAPTGTGTLKLRRHESLSDKHAINAGRPASVYASPSSLMTLADIQPPPNMGCAVTGATNNSVPISNASGLNGSGPSMLSGSETLKRQQQYQSQQRKIDMLMEENDLLHKKFAELSDNHNNAILKLELAQTELMKMRKDLDEMRQQFSIASRERESLQRQSAVAARQCEGAMRERDEARKQLAKVQAQRDDAMKEINQAINFRIKATKDLARLTEERNAAVHEYSLIMSERDSVHKEIEKIHEELNESHKKTRHLENEKKTLLDEIEGLKREVTSVLIDRDRFLKECNDLKDKYGEYMTLVVDATSPTSPSKAPFHFWGSSSSSSWAHLMNKNSNSDLMKLHHLSASNSSSVSTLSQQTAQRRKLGTTTREHLDQANMEIEALRRHIDKIQSELNEALQEVDVCKRRRDWAFSERDKIVLERESIRSLCDRLRKERDRVMSDLAQALRDSDDLKKQLEDSMHELNSRRKDNQEKGHNSSGEDNHSHLANNNNNNSSCDSAIDADSSRTQIQSAAFHSQASARMHQPMPSYSVPRSEENPYGQITDGLATLRHRSSRIKMPAVSAFAPINAPPRPLSAVFSPNILATNTNPLVEHNSNKHPTLTQNERVSPLPFHFNVKWITADGEQVENISPEASRMRQIRMPRPGEIRIIEIFKNSEPLGIHIVACNERGGVFISIVAENSLAEQVGLMKGDQLIEVSGVNLRMATYESAAKVLQTCGNDFWIKVQYNPEMFREREHSGSLTSAKGSLLASPLFNSDSRIESARDRRDQEENQNERNERSLMDSQQRRGTSHNSLNITSSPSASSSTSTLSNVNKGSNTLGPNPNHNHSRIHSNSAFETSSRMAHRI